MPFVIVALTLFAALMAADADAGSFVLSGAITDPTRTLRFTDTTEPMQEDSLTIKEMHRPFDIENVGLRILAKVAVGTFSGIAFTGVTMGVLDRIYEPYGDPDANAYREIGFSLFGAVIGCSSGFPLGISSVDPYDSLPKTLLAGVIPGAMGTGLIWAGQEIGFVVAYVFPVISSLAASEASRQPLSAALKSKPQGRRISFGLAPTLNGGLFTVTTLRF